MAFSIEIIIQALCLAGCLFACCAGQSLYPMPSGVLATNVMATGYGPPRLPSMSGFYADPYHNRPTAMQSSYGYGMSTAIRKSASNSEEALDNAQKTAMEPLNSVMSSLPSDPLTVQPLPQLARVPFSQRSSDDCGKNSSEQKSIEIGQTSMEQIVPPDQQPMIDGLGQTAEWNVPYICPCKPKGKWLFAEYPTYNPSANAKKIHYENRKSTLDQELRTWPGQSYKIATGYPYQEVRGTPSQMGWNYPSQYTGGYTSQQSKGYPTQQQNQMSPRTYWLPWMVQNPQQAYLGYQTHSNNRRYQYGRY